jgi:hypothetical protein
VRREREGGRKREKGERGEGVRDKGEGREGGERGAGREDRGGREGGDTERGLGIFSGRKNRLPF